MVNNVILVGRLTKDLDVDEKENGKKLSVFNLAVTRNYKNKEGQYDTDFIRCVLWDKLAENTSEYCKKGDVVGLKGRLETRSYQNETEETKHISEVVVEKVTFLSSKKEKENN